MCEKTKKIHELLPQVAEKTGKKIEVEYNSRAKLSKDHKTHDILTIHAFQPPQIRQILVALEEVLGENPEYTEHIQLCKELIDETVHTPYREQTVYSDMYKHAKVFYSDPKEFYSPRDLYFNQPLKSKAQALCQRWLDGLNPLFGREPETVLQELLEVLENLTTPT